jgi:phage-related protein
LGRVAKDDLLDFPEEVVDDFGYALYLVRIGGKPPNAKPWKGEGSGVLEIVEAHRGDTYRAVYTVRFPEAVYVLHCFQKKSPSGTRTARVDRNRIHDRLRVAAQDYEVKYGREKA